MTEPDKMLWSFVGLEAGVNGQPQPFYDWIEIATTKESALIQARMTWMKVQNISPSPKKQFVVANQISMFTLFRFLHEKKFDCNFSRMVLAGDPIMQKWEQDLINQLQRS